MALVAIGLVAASVATMGAANGMFLSAAATGMITTSGMASAAFLYGASLGIGASSIMILPFVGLFGMFEYTQHNGFDVLAFLLSQSAFTLGCAFLGGMAGSSGGKDFIGLFNTRYMFDGLWWNPNHGPACLFYKIFKI